ncbi:MAG: PPC domain-containing DNA-binding protein [Candidatus Micrarchaeia archaeon]|jgi:predicted DNA-binding protein with PD1-like motif
MEIKKEGNMFFVRMEDGEDFFEGLEKIVKQNKIKGGFLFATLGQFKNVEIAYFLKEKKEYIKKDFNDIFEIVNLSGNISYFENNFLPHVHVVLANKNFKCVGGHLNKATVCSTLEMLILTTKTRFIKKIDKTTGLKILNFSEK